MKDLDKTREQLLGELEETRQRVIELESLTASYERELEELRPMAQRFQSIFDMAPDGIGMVDKKGIVTTCNKTFLNLTGFSEEEIVGKHFTKLPTLRAKDIPKWIKIFASLATGKEMEPFEISWIHKDGTSHKGEIRGSLVKVGGRIVGIQCFARDITERKQAEDAIRESEERYRALLDTGGEAGLGIIVIQDTEDREAAIVFLNRQVSQLSGYSAEELLGESVWKLLSPKDLEMVRRRYRKRQEGKDVVPTYETIGLRKDGTQIPIEISAGITIYNGKPATVAYFKDITERKQAEENLRESKERFQALVESTGDFIWEVDVNGVYTYCSPKGEELWGYTPEYLVGKTPFELMIPEDRERFIKEIRKISESRSPIKGIESSSYDSNGQVVILETSGVPFYDNHGRLLGFRGTSRDITEQKRAENALRESEDRYRTLVDTAGDAGLGIVVLQNISNREAIIVFSNPAASTISGYSTEELRGKSIWNFMAREHLATIQDIYRRRQKGEDVVNSYETFGLRKDGMQVPIEISAGIIAYDGKLATVAYFRDITERKQAEEDIRQSKEIVSKAFHSNPTMMMILNLETRKFVEVNEAFINTTGYTHEELISLSIEGLNLWASQEDEEKMLARLAGSDKIKDEEFHIRTKSGGIRTWLCSADIIEIDGARCLICAASDITERRRAEEALKASEERFRLIAETSPYYIFQVDKNGNIMYSSPAIYNILGYTPEERIGKAYTDLIAPWNIQRAMERSKELSQGKAIQMDFEIDLIHKDGRIINAAGSMVSFCNNDEIVSYYGILRDVSDLKNAERVLRESEEKWRSIFERADDGIALLDLEGTICEANDSALRILGLRNKKELIGKNSFNFISSYDRDRANQDFQDFIKTGPFPDPQYIAVRKDGSTIPIEINAGVLADSYGKSNGIVIILRDISERIALDEERQRAAKLESIGTLAGGIAHDFNNYLASILGNIGIARKYVESGNVAASHLLEAEEVVSQARDLTQQLLTFARGGAPIKKIISVGSIVEDTTRFALRGSSVKPEFSIPDDLWPAEADESQIRQVISNLIINAVEAMQGGGFIQIKAENHAIHRKGIIPLPKGDYIKLIITDHGTGIPQELLTRIFDPYFTTKKGGSGLGLATVYSIVKAHGGHIELESRVGSGTTFRIFLPASKKTMLKLKSRRKPPQLLLLKQSRVLVMDDNESVRKMLVKILNDMVDEIAVAADGAEAIKKYTEAMGNSHPYDAVIMDLTIPGGIGGREAIKSLLEIDPQANVIVSSGYSDHRIMSEYKKHGFSGVLRKPYDIEELQSTIEGTLKRRKKSNNY